MREFKSAGSNRYAKRPKKDDGYRINREIMGTEVRLIDEAGTMLGVMSPREALSIAESRGLDLIEIAPTAKPPTCKIMDYGKWKYENKKKAQAAKKKQTVISVKELQVRPRTDDHDLDVKLRQAREFLLEGDKVKFNMRFSGREMAHQEFGYELLKRVVKELSVIAMVETSPKMEGRQLFVLFAPDPIKTKEYLKTHKPTKSATAKPAASKESADKE